MAKDLWKTVCLYNPVVFRLIFQGVICRTSTGMYAMPSVLVFLETTLAPNGYPVTPLLVNNRHFRSALCGLSGWSVGPSGGRGGRYDLTEAPILHPELIATPGSTEYATKCFNIVFCSFQTGIVSLGISFTNKKLYRNLLQPSPAEASLGTDSSTHSSLRLHSPVV